MLGVLDILPDSAFDLLETVHHDFQAPWASLMLSMIQ